MSFVSDSIEMNGLLYWTLCGWADQSQGSGLYQGGAMDGAGGGREGIQ